MVLLSLAALLTVVGENHVVSAASLDQVTTSTMTFESFATSPSPLEQIFNGPFTVLSTTGTNLPCELWAVSFNATTGQYVSGTFGSDIPVSLFVVQQTSYQNWMKAGTCGNMGDAIAGQLITMSYSIPPAAIPNSGTWVIVIVNSSNARNADGYLAAYLSIVPYPVTQPLTGTVTMTSISTTTVLSGQPVPGFPVASIIIGILAGLIAIVMLRRRNETRQRIVAVPRCARCELR
jgi:hypothetical protein